MDRVLAVVCAGGSALVCAGAAASPAPAQVAPNRYVLETSARPEAETTRAASAHFARALNEPPSSDEPAWTAAVMDRFHRAIAVSPAGAEMVLALAASGIAPRHTRSAVVAACSVRSLPRTERVATLLVVLLDHPENDAAAFGMLECMVDRRSPAEVRRVVVQAALARWPADDRVLSPSPLMANDFCGVRTPPPVPFDARSRLIELAASIDVGVLARLPAPRRPANGELPTEARARFVLECCRVAPWYGDAAVLAQLVAWLVPELTSRPGSTPLGPWDRAALGVLASTWRMSTPAARTAYEPLLRDAACKAFLVAATSGGPGPRLPE